MLLKDNLFDSQHLALFVTDVDRSEKFYEQFGFVHEGCKRRLYYQHGSPIDMLIMALLLEQK